MVLAPCFLDGEIADASDDRHAQNEDDGGQRRSRDGDECAGYKADNGDCDECAHAKLLRRV